MNDAISIIIPTFNGGETFKQCLETIRGQRKSLDVQLIVIDSGSSDGTVESAKRAGAQIIQIRKQDFHHSRTRNLGLQYAINDRVVFLVQDAIPITTDWLGVMSDALERDQVAAVYGQHIPHDNADLFAWYETTAHREFLGNSPLVQTVESGDSFFQLPYDQALRRIRCDNVCAMYRRDLLERYPFPDVVFGEDMAWAKLVLLAGFKVKYDPAIQVIHSHNRTPEYRFRRVLISNIVLASILERVREDLSFLTLKDLEAAELILQSRLKTITDIQNKEDGNGPLNLAPFWSSLNRIPYFNSALALIHKTLTGIGKRRHWAFSFPRIVNVHIDSVLSRVKEAFPAATNSQILYCAEQVTALIKGDLYGGVVASCQLKGLLPSELENAIRPFLGGV